MILNDLHALSVGPLISKLLDAQPVNKIAEQTDRNGFMCYDPFMERITQAQLHSFLIYDQDIGHFYWRRLTSYRSRLSGKLAGTIGIDGYTRINICGRPMVAHRLAWLYIYGTWPKEQIDHINGHRSDNRLCNLRLATRHENMRNSRRKITNKSGLKGVSWSRECAKWRACITRDGKSVHLGLFHDKFAAYDAYCKAAIKAHGAYARLD
jgi:hypothetical protein